MSAMPSQQTFDVIILGGGMAGAALAAHLDPKTRVALVEREPVVGYHTTGRSAAMYIPSYGGAAIAGLTRASRAFFLDPPTGFGPPLLSPRPVMHIADADQTGRLDAFAARGGFEVLDGRAARARVPILRPGSVVAALIETDAGDLDVARLHAAFLHRAEQAGTRVLTGAGDCVIVFEGSEWRVRATGLDISAPVLVNAAGAWADEVAISAGLAPLGLTPLRRTVMLAKAPEHADFAAWPVVKDIDERFYFRPCGGQLLITPADETPSAPCDAAADEMDIAVGMARFEAAADHPVRHLISRWAGLRTFAPDRAPVVGWSKSRPGFFWLAGLGGFGIQTAPAMGRLAAALVEGRPVPSELVDHGVQREAYGPERFRLAA
ncbi:NAD(P)/FAD-dependent oxidoreductase [Caulobacter sp.]|uniref:NAD(P)/FAD-dependent oxidoreductase n=1 Tax=Caulobacter sp. TaxID=78 RepID=UPI003BB1ADE8